MANIRQATLTLRVDSTRAYQDLRKFIGAADLLHTSSTRATSTLDRLQRQLLRLVSAYAGFSVLRQSIRDFADFEKQLAVVHTMLYQGNSHFLPQYAKQLRALSIQMGEDTSTLAKGLYDVLSATIPAAEAMELLETTSKAAIGGLTNTATATDAVISVMKSYGLGTEYAAKVSSDLFEVVQRGEITFEELAHNIGHVAPIAAQAGVSLEELLAFIATTTRAGLRAELAVTAVKNAISEFIKPSREGALLARELGFALDSATIKGMGLRGVFEELKDQSPEVLATLFADIRGVNAVMATLGQLEDFFFDFDHISQTSGEHLRAYNKLADTTAIKFQRFWQAIKALRVALGEVLAPVVAEVTDKITKWVQQDPERFRQYGELLSVEIHRWKDLFLAFAEYLQEDFSGAAGIAMDIFVVALELAGKQAVDLALRTGHGIWQAVKDGVLGNGPSQANLETRAKQLYFEHGGRGTTRNSRDIKILMDTEVDAVTGDPSWAGAMLRPWTMKQAMTEAERQLRQEQAQAKRDELWGSYSPNLRTDFEEAASRIRGAWRLSTAERPLGSQVDAINSKYNAQRQAVLEGIRGEKLTRLQNQILDVLWAPAQYLHDAIKKGEDWVRENSETFGDRTTNEMTQEDIDRMRRQRDFNREIHQHIEAVGAETRALRMNRQEAERAIEITRLQLRAKEDGVELSELQSIALGNELRALQETEKLRQIGDEVGRSFSQGFADATLRARDLKDALAALENAAVRMMERILEIMVWEPMAQNISTSFMHFMQPSPQTTAAPASMQSPYYRAAHGGLFRRGRVIPFASGGIIDRPTMFPLSSGTGLAGENGPEWAIAPLKRMPSGNLGVETSGVPAPSIKADIHLHNESRADLTGEVSHVRFDGRRMMVGMVLKDRRNNGPMHRAQRRR